MSNASESHDELPRLLSGLADGTLNAAHEQRLAELLQTDPAARARYYDHAMLSALLRREGRRAAAQNRDVVPLALAGDGTSTRFAGARVPATLSGRLRPWLPVLAATILLGLLLSVGEATGVTRLLPTMIRIVTGEGALVIEVDDPGVSVTLDGQDITITGAGIHELRLRPGTHKFVATKDGQPLREEVVTIEHGGRRVLKVSRQPLPASVRPESQDQTDSRLAHTTEVQKQSEPPPAAAPTRWPPRVLIVVPSHDFFYAEVGPVRNQLATYGVTWHIASTTLDECQPTAAGGPPIQLPIKPDLLLADAKAADYGAIYFCGGKGCEEYAGQGPHAAEARRLINEALAANRTVSAMSIGVVVLAEADALAGRRTACFPYGQPPGIYRQRMKACGAICTEEAVVEDGPFLTGRATQHVNLFSHALLKRLGIEPRQPSAAPGD